ncbi:4-hydroxythreonine-4-phosphate dehydrogenase PdxA [Consotaella salsifontis]|uniref:4-hydroxythreonine-4-phosphate dehydrogenase n=1 Tax=Consotaella salsifontis TaxID=1365950 RepID=A0A1T4T2I3_9HYPH|nr:4-hydroxythreonine-4-phosphate dehydrogenase PdxA [Consotaella salsifontis]SKA34358.1 4-hydroxythreonine-4-phosphate dehydrogenase [Consotaella salsifontis]
MATSRPIIAITMGDPAGIGPEIAAKALAHDSLQATSRPLIVGEPSVMQAAIDLTGAPLTLHRIDSVDEARFEAGTMNVLAVAGVDAAALRRGEVSAACGKASYDCIVKAIELAKADNVDATVTNPINKEALAKAGLKFAGHTEIYAHHTGTSRYTMMLAEGNFRVVHVSTHVSLREACDRVKKARVREVIGLADEACRLIGIAEPKVAVAGLNPHCGEGGLFGTEDMEEIAPAVAAAQADGIKVDGPIPADTVFSKLNGGMYDIVVCMYHDQGHIPTKLLGFRYDAAKGAWDNVSGVNITLGLPIIRTSVDHGTAFDLAGTGKADCLSLINAIDYATQLAKGRLSQEQAS